MIMHTMPLLPRNPQNLSYLVFNESIAYCNLVYLVKTVIFVYQSHH